MAEILLRSAATSTSSASTAYNAAKQMILEQGLVEDNWGRAVMKPATQAALEIGLKLREEMLQNGINPLDTVQHFPEYDLTLR